MGQCALCYEVQQLRLRPMLDGKVNLRRAPPIMAESKHPLLTRPAASLYRCLPILVPTPNARTGIASCTKADADRQQQPTPE